MAEPGDDPKELWVVPGFAHAERGVNQALVDRIGRWVQQAANPPEVLATESAASDQPSSETAGRAYSA